MLDHLEKPFVIGRQQRVKLLKWAGTEINQHNKSALSDALLTVLFFYTTTQRVSMKITVLWLLTSSVNSIEKSQFLSGDSKKVRGVSSSAGSEVCVVFTSVKKLLFPSPRVCRVCPHRMLALGG